MASFNYRVMRHTRPNGDEFAIHEVFYDDNGQVNGWTENALSVFCLSLEDLKLELDRYNLAIEKPVLDFRLYSKSEENS